MRQTRRLVLVESNSQELFENQCRIGTRGSDLALWQAHKIQADLAELGVNAELTIIKTHGDKIDDVPFSKLEGKNFFTKELEDAQLDGRVDLAVHSLKDLATDMVPGLALCAMVGREDPRELLLAHPGSIDQSMVAKGDVIPLK
ncbi:MAG: hydroxymethylbilane synthase, partial [Candidatus Krumholzibacteriia bacterium]